MWSANIDNLGVERVMGWGNLFHSYISSYATTIPYIYTTFLQCTFAKPQILSSTYPRKMASGLFTKDTYGGDYHKILPKA